jgi:hypothetical protein
MNKAIGGSDLTSTVQGTVASPAKGLIVNLGSGDIVRVVGINITEAFDDLNATLTIGTESDPDEIMSVDLSDLADRENYITICNAILSSPKSYKYFLTKGTATVGKFDIVFTFGQC